MSDSTLDPLLHAHGWVMECESPLELRHSDTGDFASGYAARVLIAHLQELSLGSAPQEVAPEYLLPEIVALKTRLDVADRILANSTVASARTDLSRVFHHMILPSIFTSLYSLGYPSIELPYELSSGTNRRLHLMNVAKHFDWDEPAETLFADITILRNMLAQIQAALDNLFKH